MGIEDGLCLRLVFSVKVLKSISEERQRIGEAHTSSLSITIGSTGPGLSPGLRATA